MPKKSIYKQKIQDFILQNLRQHPNDIIPFTKSHFDVSRQSIWIFLNDLINNNKILKTGSTKGTHYELIPIVKYKDEYPIEPSLAEDVVWRNNVAPLLKTLPKNVYDLYQYGFTEIFNNAIDHSDGTKICVELVRYDDLIQLSIEDNGIGIFKKIQELNNLDDPIDAILELAKGKLTTDPEHHTGEGIFFSSRMFDKYYIISYGLSFTHDLNYDFDVMFEEQKPIVKGTNVIMSISPYSKTTIKQIFDEYTVDKETRKFDRTIVPVSLAQYGNENLISRSQAKRLLHRFDKFREVVLDFEKVDNIGQAFTDEVFRVFPKEYPNVHLTFMNANKNIESMIESILTHE